MLHAPHTNSFPERPGVDRPPRCTLSGCRAGDRTGAGRRHRPRRFPLPPWRATAASRCPARRLGHGGGGGSLTYPERAPGDPRQTLPSPRSPFLRRAPSRFSKMAETLLTVEAARPAGLRNFRPCSLRRLWVLPPCWKRANFLARLASLRLCWGCMAECGTSFSEDDFGHASSLLICAFVLQRNRFLCSLIN